MSNPIDENNVLIADVRTTDELKAMFKLDNAASKNGIGYTIARQTLQWGFGIKQDVDGQRRANPTAGVHMSVSAGATRTPNMDNWPKPLVKGTIDFERKMLALVDAAQQVKVDHSVKLNQDFKPVEQPYRTTATKVTFNPKLGL